MKVSLVFEIRCNLEVPQTTTVTPQMVNAIRGRLNAITDKQIEEAIATIFNASNT